MYWRIALSILIIFSCVFANSAYAEVGPLTAKYQEMIKDSGAVFIKCNAYSLYDVNYGNKKQKMIKPTVLKEIAINTNDIYCYEVSKNLYYGGRDKRLTLAKGNKVYVLDLYSKTGEYYDVPLHSEASVVNSEASVVNMMGGNNLIPDALIYILPKGLRNSQMQGLTSMYRYKKAYYIQMDNVTYQCEEYGNFVDDMTDNGKKKLFKMPSMINLDRTYKLYFLDGRLVKYGHGDRIADVIEVNTTFDSRLFEIPKGFTVRGHNQKLQKDVNKGMDDLLQRSTVERY